MFIRVHDTNFEGRPVPNSGCDYRGESALGIVAAMQMDPFNASLKPNDYMRKTLDRISMQDVVLPSDPNAAAEVFLKVLVDSEFATVQLDGNDLLKVFGSGSSREEVQ